MFGYSRYIVSYCDVLGFQSIIYSHRDPHEIGSILRSLQTFSSPTGTKDIFYTSFSDLVIRGRVLRSVGTDEIVKALAQEARDLLFAQTELATRSVFVRGAITVGLLCVQSGVIFGPALIEAYKMERDLASFPRVIVDAKITAVLRDFSSSSSPLSNLLRSDSDGITFVDYLRGRRRSCSRPDYMQILAAHGAAIRHFQMTANSNGSASLIDKARWLRSYHNSVVLELPSDYRDSTLAEQQALIVEMPTTIVSQDQSGPAAQP